MECWVSRARSTELLHFISSHPLTSFISRNQTLIYLPLSGSLDSLLCNLIAATPRQSLSFPELSISSLSSLDTYSDYVEVNISLNDSSSFSFLNVYAPPIRFSSKDSRTNFFSPCGTALSNCSLCGSDTTLSFSAGSVCSSFSAEAYAILQALC